MRRSLVCGCGAVAMLEAHTEAAEAAIDRAELEGWSPVHPDHGLTASVCCGAASTTALVLIEAAPEVIVREGRWGLAWEVPAQTRIVGLCPSYVRGAG